MEYSNSNNTQLTTLSSAPPALRQPPATGIAVTAGSNTTSYAPSYTATQIPTQVRTDKQEWSTGLFGCFSDIPSCFKTLCCPCVTFGQIAEIVDRGATSCGTSAVIYVGISHFLCCVWVYTYFYRTKMRKQYMLPETPCPDCIAHCLCHKHALCQEYRELKNRGFDMAIGWHANMERMNQGVTMVPVVQGAMVR